MGVPKYGAYTAPIIGEPPPKHVGHQKKQNSIAACCRTVRQHTVDGVTIRYPLMGWRFATHRRGGRVSRPHRLAVPRVSRPTGADRAAEVIPIWYIWVQAWRMWNHMPELLWILAGFNITKLVTLKLVFFPPVFLYLGQIFYGRSSFFST